MSDSEGLLARLKTHPQRRESLALLALNALGATGYWVAASASWAIPEERANGIYSVTGEPFVWAGFVLPIIAIFLLVNLGWAAVILAKRRWQEGRLWLIAPLMWLVVISVDFAHH